MTFPDTSEQTQPLITAVITGRSGELRIDGEPQSISGVNADALRASVMARVLEVAAQLGPVHMNVVEGGVETTLRVDPTGSVTEVGRPALHPVQAPPARAARPVAEEVWAPQHPAPQPASSPWAAAGHGAAGHGAAGQPVVRQGERPSFITVGRSVQPAERGWRGAVNQMGLRLNPGPEETRYRADVAAVARHWPGTRTVAVANQKGSASKTPTCACLSACFARFGGAGVLAWDNNETEGTLRFRTEWAAHQATLLHLLPKVDQLLAPTAEVAAVSSFVHHQPADKYDVLWSDTTIDGEHVVSAQDVEAIHRVASRYYRMVIMDSGNSNRAPNWRAMMEHADALVVPCTEVEDTAEVGARLLETLANRDERSAAIARNALVVVSQRTKQGKNVDRIVEGFEGLARKVVRIPYDPALETGVIRFGALAPRTQRAWLGAAAALTEAL